MSGFCWQQRGHDGPCGNTGVALVRAEDACGLVFGDEPRAKVLRVRRNGDVLLDGESLGYVVRNERRLYEAVASDGRVLCSTADCKTTAMSLLARRLGALRVGDRFIIAGVPSATGGPWTVA